MGYVVAAPDKFKGSLTAPEVAAHLAAGLRRHSPDVEVRQVPVADGGDGTVEALLVAGYSRVPVQVAGPTGRPVVAAFARRGATAVVELAEASGLRRLPDGRPDPMNASSRGTGELVRAALDAGCDGIVIGVGGSACTDGGSGMLQALGVGLLDRHGHQIAGGGAGLRSLRAVDLAGLDPRIQQARVTLASDVDNPLIGPSGAAAVYAPQKGANPAEVDELERALQELARLLAEVTGQDVAARPGAGAAGGVGFAALSVLGAEMQPGIELVLSLIGFDAVLQGARLVITGEGSLDGQSLHGKAPLGVATAAARAGVPTIAVAGSCSLTSGEVAAAGLRAAYALSSLEPDPARCMARAGSLVEELAATAVGPDWLG